MLSKMPGFTHTKRDWDFINRARKLNPDKGGNMLPIKSIETVKAVKSLESLLPLIGRKNSQRGTRLDYEFHSSSLIKIFKEKGYMEGIYCDAEKGHIHFLVHLNYTAPVVELLAADPSKKPYEVIEKELIALQVATRSKYNREQRRKKAMEAGEEPPSGGPGANCSDIYVWSGDGDTDVSRSNFNNLVLRKKVTDYYVKVAIRLEFAAVKYPRKRKSVRKERFLEA